jgi:drug/metabolite transporter (DMT)-like permease
MTVQHSRPILALGLRFAGASFLAGMLAMVKYASQGGVSLAEIAFWRQAVAIPILGAFLIATRQLGQLRTKRLPIHFRRSALGMAILVINFMSTILLPLAMATTLSFTAPLFVVVLSVLFLKETVGPWRWGAVLLGFVGVVIVAQPGAAGNENIPLLGAALALFTAFMVAIINFQIRDLARTETTIAMTFYFALFGAPLAGLFMPFYATAHNPEQWLLLLGIGLVGTACQLCISASLRFASVSRVIVMDYSAIVTASILGWLIWDQLPTLAMYLGAPLIIAAGIIIAWREHRLSKSTSPTSAAAID